MSKMKIMTVLGTRPEIIRLSRIIPILDEHSAHILVHTGQNYDDRLNKIFFAQAFYVQNQIFPKNIFMLRKLFSAYRRE